MPDIEVPRITCFVELSRLSADDVQEHPELPNDTRLVLKTEFGDHVHLNISDRALTKMSECLAKLLQMPNSPLMRESPGPDKAH